MLDVGVGAIVGAGAVVALSKVFKTLELRVSRWWQAKFVADKKNS